jgi:MFS transporter, DHA1 family, multidrug resistance protein
MKQALSARAAFALIASGTVLGIAGTDLVLPAVPSLPAALGGTPAEAQYVLVAFVAGAGVGLVFFGELGARFDPRKLLAASIGLYALLSFAAASAAPLQALILIRFFQGAAAAAPAVFAPGFIRALFAPERATAMIGLLGSIESLAPALAPIVGVWLLLSFGWRASFVVVGAGGAVLATVMSAFAHRLPPLATQSTGRGYAPLLRNLIYWRYALSHAFALGGIVTFVFAAPVVMVGPLGGTIADFVWLQISGIAFFILAANAAGRLVPRFGAERLIVGGTVLAAAASLAILAYALLGGRNPSALIPIWIVWNLGFGLRGPPGFLQAVIAARGDDARGSALVILAMLLVAASGAAVAAPFVASGLTGAAAVAAAIAVAAVGWLALPRGG